MTKFCLELIYYITAELSIFRHSTIIVFIFQVLNMKPQEILSMIEEAAGTSLYESKKQSALKTIEKKDNKLLDINKILDEELNPTLG